MKRKLLSLLLVITMLIPYLPVTQQAHAAGVIGTYGYFEPGGTTGPGGGANDIPSFRVGLIDETFKNPIESEDLSTVNKQIEDHYQNHFPYMITSIIFSPPEVYDTNSVIGWYNSSNGQLGYVGDDEKSFKHRPISYSASQAKESNIYYDRLRGIIGTDKSLKKLEEGKWETALLGGNQDSVESLKVWNNIFKDWNSSDSRLAINKKLERYTKYEKIPNTEEESVKAEKRLTNQLGYLDLLMTLYNLMPPKQKVFYEQEINRFIRGEELDSKPPLIAVDSVVRMMAPNSKLGNKKLYIPSSAYLSYVTGLTPEYNLVNPDAKASTSYSTSSDHTKELLTDLTNKALKQAPNRERVTSYTGDAFRNNAFAFSQAMHLGKKFMRTSTNEVKWYNSSVQNGIMETLKFKPENGYYGFLIVSAENVFVPNPTPEGGFSLIANGDNPEVLEVGSEKIATRANITLKSNMTGKELTDWEKLILDKTFTTGYPKINIDLKSTTLAPAQSDSTNTYPLGTVQPYKGNATDVSITPDDLLSFVKGELQVDYSQDLMNYPVESDKSYTFNYLAKVKIKLGPDSAEVVELVGNPDNAEKTFYNPKIDPPELFGTYTSTPTVYAEIKQGEPGKEAFEAMAGTPTTRNLYFAVGGSEYVASIVTKYYPDQTSERKYRSYFIGTPSEFMVGDQAKSYSVPSPSGASSSDTSVNVHGRDLIVTATWTGSIPNNGSPASASGMGEASATSIAKPDMSAYNNAKSQASDVITSLSKV